MNRRTSDLIATTASALMRMTDQQIADELDGRGAEPATRDRLTYGDLRSMAASLVSQADGPEDTPPVTEEPEQPEAPPVPTDAGWVEVVSSNLTRVRYDQGEQTLDVEFSNGSVWRYPGVPWSKWKAMMSAESVGSYFARDIKGAHSGERLDPEPSEAPPTEDDDAGHAGR